MMERLTDKRWRNFDPWEMCGLDGCCTRTCIKDGEVCDVWIKLARLAAYEDTGLEPDICAEYKKFEDEAVGKGVPFSRIVELMEAEAALERGKVEAAKKAREGGNPG